MAVTATASKAADALVLTRDAEKQQKKDRRLPEIVSVHRDLVDEREAFLRLMEGRSTSQKVPIYIFKPRVMECSFVSHHGRTLYASKGTLNISAEQFDQLPVLRRATIIPLKLHVLSGMNSFGSPVNLPVCALMVKVGNQTFRLLGQGSAIVAYTIPAKPALAVKSYMDADPRAKIVKEFDPSVREKDS